jgi:hypothetical protein
LQFWALHQSEEAALPSASFHSCLSYHTAAVNVVRFSPTGKICISILDTWSEKLLRYLRYM